MSDDKQMTREKNVESISIQTTTSTTTNSRRMLVLQMGSGAHISLCNRSCNILFMKFWVLNSLFSGPRNNIYIINSSPIQKPMKSIHWQREANLFLNFNWSKSFDCLSAQWNIHMRNSIFFSFLVSLLFLSTLETINFVNCYWYLCANLLVYLAKTRARQCVRIIWLFVCIHIAATTSTSSVADQPYSWSNISHFNRFSACIFNSCNMHACTRQIFFNASLQLLLSQVYRTAAVCCHSDKITRYDSIFLIYFFSMILFAETDGLFGGGGGDIILRLRFDVWVCISGYFKSMHYA